MLVEVLNFLFNRVASNWRLLSGSDREALAWDTSLKRASAAAF